MTNGVPKMADVPDNLSCALDTFHPQEVEDYTDWIPDDETEERMIKILMTDTGSWDLRGVHD